MSYEIICEDSLSVGPIINGSGEKVRCVDKQRKKSLIEFKITSKQTIPVSLFSATDNFFLVDLKKVIMSYCVNLSISSYFKPF